MVISDSYLIERFGGHAQSVHSLSISNMRNTSPNARRSLVDLALVILSGETTPSVFRLTNFGFDVDEG